MIDLTKYEEWDIDTIETKGRFEAENDKITSFFREVNQQGLNDKTIWNYGLWLQTAKVNLKKRFIWMEYRNGSKFIIDAKDKKMIYVDRNDTIQEREDFYSELNANIWLTTISKMCRPEIFFLEENPLRN